MPRGIKYCNTIIMSYEIDENTNENSTESCGVQGITYKYKRRMNCGA